MIPIRQPSGDEAARERIRSSLHESLIVEASAGTGKTTELVRRLLNVLRTGAGRIEKIAAVTFTHKAAGELKIRLRQSLDDARQSAIDPFEIANLEDALKHLEEAVIGTIHGFCSQILRERPVEAVVDPAFEEMSEGESARLYDRVFRAWLERSLNRPSPALRRALVRSAAPLDQLKKAGWTLIEWRDFPAAWRRSAFQREEEIDTLVVSAVELGNSSARPQSSQDNLYKSLAPLREFVARVERAESASHRDYDLLEGLLLKLRRDLKRDFRKGSGKYGADVSREAVYAASEIFQAAAGAFQERADSDLAAGLREEMRDLLDNYDSLKRKSGKLDFNDQLILTRDLLRSNAEVRRYLQERFSHVFVDEFQDTDPLQAEILILLAADDPVETEWLKTTPTPGKLFLVGDPKQSIYKFRRADLSLYASVCEELVGRGVGLVKLTHSFRSSVPLQEFVNSAFAPLMLADEGQAAYSPLSDGFLPVTDQPSIIALPAPKPYGKQRVAMKSIEECLPETIAAYIEWLIHDSGWKVRDPDCSGSLVPIRSQHIAILFRRFVTFGRDVTRDYAQALEAREIRHLLVGSKSFHDREEIETIRAALAALEWPGDELSVFAALKGSLFALPDGLLLRYRHAAGRLHPFGPSQNDPELAPVQDALAILAELHRQRNRRPLADTLNELLEATRAHAAFALRPAGHQVLANVYRVVSLARNFEQTGGISFRAFIEELERQSERTDSAEAPVMEEGAEGVRMMTVHNAKGLEFPVVILADMTCKICSTDPDRYIDPKRNLCATRVLGCAPEELLEHGAEERRREEAEGVRVAYVAATRARDLLVIPTIGDKRFEGWLSPLSDALYPPVERNRVASVASGCPKFGPTTVLERPREYDNEEELSVMPGMHKPCAGTHEVVWWDPAVLRLSVPRPQGLRYENILMEGESEGLVQYLKWKERRAETIARGTRKSRDVFIATESGSAPASTVVVESLHRRPNRPAGRPFGILVHDMLRDVAFDAGRPAIEALAASHRGTSEEIEAATEAVLNALAHPVIQRAARASRLHRELPVALPIENGRILEGTIDLAFLEGDLWTIVDFKTDADIASKRTQYERQLQWYVYALARITGQQARAVLLSL